MKYKSKMYLMQRCEEITRQKVYCTGIFYSSAT